MEDSPTDKTLTETLAILAEENAKRRTNRSRVYWCFGIGFSVLILLQLLLWIFRGTRPDFAGFGSFIALIGMAAAFTNTHKDALKKLSLLVNRDSAGYVLEAYSTAIERDVKEVCEAALPKALYCVESPSDLDPYQLGLLYKLISVNQPPEIASAALDCAGRISGSEGIAALENFRMAASKKKDPVWNRLADRVLQLLPDIRMRAARKIIETRTVEMQQRVDAEVERLHIRHDS